MDSNNGADVAGQSPYRPRADGAEIRRNEPERNQQLRSVVRRETVPIYGNKRTGDWIKGTDLWE